VIADASKLSGEQLASCLEREGIKPADFERRRIVLDEDGQGSIATTKRIRKLERELARKEKALAEAAVLLVLKKTIDSYYKEEDDDTGEPTRQCASPIPAMVIAALTNDLKPATGHSAAARGKLKWHCLTHQIPACPGRARNLVSKISLGTGLLNR
jgi:hypothetical protein